MLPGKSPILIKQEAGWAPEPVKTFLRKQNCLFLPEFETLTVQPIARGYTNNTTPALCKFSRFTKMY
jgi:hypothetical protein